MTTLQRLPIVSMTPFTLQDFPGRTACIFWFTGCNMACPYCHNPDMARGRGKRMAWERIETWLIKHRGLIDGVVLSGGECTLNPGIVELIAYIREFGYQVKIDTNGSRPQVVQKLLEREFADYVALDYKAPLDQYDRITGLKDQGEWRKSLELLMQHPVECELRCTVHPDLLPETEVNRMLKELVQLGYQGSFYLQHFVPGNTLGNLRTPSRRFNINLLDTFPGIEIRLRNFTTYEAHRFRQNHFSKTIESF